MKQSTIRVVDYDPIWSDRFKALRSHLLPVIQDIAMAVEHVGSTAVLGLAAKPIIDVDIVVRDRTYLLTAIDRLATLGYIHRGNLGIEGREAFAAPPDAVAHHLYVCLFDSPALKNHLVVRDYLRRYPEIAKAYGNLKKQLARTFSHDIEKYIDGKTDFILKILQRLY